MDRHALPDGHRFLIEEIDQTIPARFATQVKRYGSRIAVRTDSGGITYRHLDRATNQLACAVLSQTGSAGNTWPYRSR